MMGYTAAKEIEEADVILLNTCAIRENAHNKVIGILGRIKHLKETNKDLITVVCGCMAQEESIAKMIRDKYPWIDIVLGTHNFYELPVYISKVLEDNKQEICVYSIEGDVIEDIPTKRDSKVKAWVNIQYGCDKFCSYCIVPYTRGKQRSRLPKDILKEVEELKNNGYKEVTLLGQNVNAYGKDLDINYTMADLLRDTSKIGIDRIRFVTSHPWDFTDEMIDVIAKYDNIMPYIHLPIQSGSDSILKKMNRRYTIDEYKELFYKLKNKIDNVSITTDIIVGFPNETEEDFEETLKVYNELKYDLAYTFIYSPREGTPAAKIKDSVSLEEKEKRLQRLNELVNKYAKEANNKYLNKVVKVLIEGPSDKGGKMMGYTDTMKLVNVDCDPKYLGEIVDVVITDIKMPYMDGLELSKRLNDDYRNIHIIIFTGFDEFEYAKEAVHLEVEEYMLKPINSDELTECLKRVKNSLDLEREEKLNVQKLENYFNDVLPILQTNLFVSLIEGRVDEEEYVKFVDSYKIDLKGPFYCCVVFHTSTHHVPENMEPLLLSMSVEREIKERIAKKFNCKEFIYLGNTVLIVELSSKEKMVEFTDICDKFCKWVNRVIGAVVTAGIGRVCDNILNINNSYEGAREAVSYRVLYGTNRAINIEEIAPNEQNMTLQSEDSKMHDLFKAIYLGDNKSIEDAVSKEIEKLHKNANTVSQYNLVIMEMVGAFYRFCANNFIDFNDFLGDINNPYERVPQMDESTLKNWLIKCSLGVSEKLKSVRNSKSRSLVNDAQNIVTDRYMEPDLSLDKVCSIMGVSNSYFSSVFKKEVGKSFVTYLTDYRMDIAAGLILDTNEKSYKIAEQVGYLDANYFSYVFKKKFGVSPSKYRNERLNK